MGGGGVTLVDKGFSTEKAGKESCSHGSTLSHQKPVLRGEGGDPGSSEDSSLCP